VRAPVGVILMLATRFDCPEAVAHWKRTGVIPEAVRVNASKRARVILMGNLQLLFL
jgi:hypothetical protein